MLKQFSLVGNRYDQDGIHNCHARSSSIGLKKIYKIRGKNLYFYAKQSWAIFCSIKFWKLNRVLQYITSWFSIQCSPYAYTSMGILFNFKSCCCNVLAIRRCSPTFMLKLEFLVEISAGIMEHSGYTPGTFDVYRLAHVSFRRLLTSYEVSSSFQFLIINKKLSTRDARSSLLSWRHSRLCSSLTVFSDLMLRTDETTNTLVNRRRDVHILWYVLKIRSVLLAPIYAGPIHLSTATESCS